MPFVGEGRGEGEEEEEEEWWGGGIGGDGISGIEQVI